MDSRQIAESAVRCALEKKAQDVALMDMREATIICDYFIIATGTSRPHNRAIADHIQQTLKNDLDVTDKRIQGKRSGGWILMDYKSVVIHVFLENLREYYNLEELWQRAPIEYPELEEVSGSTSRT